MKKLQRLSGYIAPLFVSSVFLLCSFLLALSAPVYVVSAEDFTKAEYIKARRAFFDPPRRAKKFRTVETIFPTRTMSRATDVLELPKSGRAGDFSVRYEFNGKKYDLEAFNEHTHSTALLILKDGAIVKEMYLNGAYERSLFMSFSTGKSVTSTLIGMAIDDGYIESVAEPLTRYLPALTGSAYDGVTIKDALQMLSGVAWNEEVYDWADKSIAFTRLWHASLVEQRYRYVAGANTLTRAHAPGSKFNYNTLETCLLGWLLENATQKRLSTYMEERLWQPAGMEANAAWILDGPEDIGRELGGGGLLATLRDYGRFGLLIMNNGRINGRELLSPEWIREATTPDREAIQYGNLYEGSSFGYGYQWWLRDEGRFAAEGVYGQFIFIAPREDVVIVKFSAWPDAWIDDMEAETLAFFAAVIEALK